MACHDDYTVGWICALPLEMAAAKAMLDRRHPDLPADPNDTNAYVLGSLSGHNVVVACLPFGVYGTTSAATVATQMLASFKSIRFSLMVGIGGGVPSTKEDIRLGDIVVSRPTAGRPGIIQYDFGKKIATEQFNNTGTLNKPSAILLTAAGKVETNNILGESQIPRYISSIVQKDLVFASPGPEQDVLFQSDYDHVENEDACDHCDPERIQARQPRASQNPKVHYGLVASGNQVMRHGLTRDKLAREHGILCFEMEAAGLMDIAQCLVIRGICDYADSHKNKRWQGYAAAAAAAYAKEILTLIPTLPTTGPLTSVTDPSTAALLDALLLTKPEVDRSSLIALKGRRVDGTCEWLLQHPRYQEWLEDADPPLLWISGGPGKGKTMLAIYLTEVLQPVVHSAREILLYYFCSSRDKRRNSAITIMRGVLHQWLSFHPDLAQYIRNYFDGPETTKYTISSFVCLWKLFLIILHQVGSCKVVCVLDGLDECDEGLKEFLDALREYYFESEERPRARLKIILLSRPQPALLESKLRRFHRIKLDDSDMEVKQDVERYISTKVAELASENILSEDRLLQVREALMAGAEGTFLWVGFVADELKGRSWLKINDILRSVPKGLVGIYQQLLQQVEDKETLIPILQWVVLAVRPMTMDELAEAVGIQASDTQTPAEILKDRLVSCGLLVKIDGDVVNLVHESAREFFQSDQVNIEGINVFYMNSTNHRALMRTCLAIIERNYKSPGSISDASHHNTLLTYAGLHWPQHFRYAFDMVEARSEFSSRQFFRTESPVREDWWRFYWDREQYGGSPPSFTLLHLAAYFGNPAWAKTLLDHDPTNAFHLRRLISRRDSYGRTPLFWAAARGHREVVELLLDHGANINTRDREKLTALHIAVTGTHKDVVSLLIDRTARIEEKANYGETPLIRAIRTGSKDIVRLLLERGARVDQLPTPPGMGPLKGPTAPLEDRARELLGLRDHLFAARYESESQLVDLAIRILTFSLGFPPFFRLVALYLRHWAVGGWEVLQDLVKNDEEAKLREWAHVFIKFGNQLVDMRDPKKLDAVETLSVNVFEVVSTPALGALLVIGIMVGSSVILRSTRHRWGEGVDISARTFARFASLAYRRDASEALDSGVRRFLVDLDASIRNGRTEETVERVEVAFNALLAVLSTRDPRPIEYMLTVIREYFEGFISGGWAEQLLNESSQACANEFNAFNERQDSLRLNRFLSAIFQLAEHASEKGQVWFLNLIPASCQVLCRADPGGNLHRWLIGEGIPVNMSALISRQQESVRKQAFKAFVECLIIGRQSGFSLSMTVRASVKRNLELIDGVDRMLDEILDS